jgi:integrase
VIRSSSLPTYLTQSEVRTFFATISNPRDRLLFGLAYAFALRVGEIELLDREDLDLERERIRIHRLKGGLSGERLARASLTPERSSWFPHPWEAVERMKSSDSGEIRITA